MVNYSFSINLLVNFGLFYVKFSQKKKKKGTHWRECVGNYGWAFNMTSER